MAFSRNEKPESNATTSEAVTVKHIRRITPTSEENSPTNSPPKRHYFGYGLYPSPRVTTPAETLETEQIKKTDRRLG